MAVAVTQAQIEDAINRAIAPVSVRAVASEQIQYLPIGEAHTSQEVVVTFRDQEEMASRICLELQERGYLLRSLTSNDVFHQLMQGWSLGLKSKNRTYRAGQIPRAICDVLQRSQMVSEFAQS